MACIVRAAGLSWHVVVSVCYGAFRQPDAVACAAAVLWMMMREGLRLGSLRHASTESVSRMCDAFVCRRSVAGILAVSTSSGIPCVLHQFADKAYSRLHERVLKMWQGRC